jgi:5-methylthioadenosine/S-adenosylhomocysteine deaminase
MTRKGTSDRAGQKGRRPVVGRGSPRDHQGGPDACDLLVRKGCVITMDAKRRVFPDGSVAVSGGRIVGVGPDREVGVRFRGRRVIEANGAPVHPGFFDCHAHLSFHLTRGAFPDIAHGEYDRLYKNWQNSITPEEEHASALLACLEMLHNGVTYFLEPGTVWETDAAVKAAERIGIRGSVAEPFLWDIDTQTSQDVPRSPIDTKRAQRLLGKELWRNKDKDTLVRGHVGLFGAGTSSDELLLAAKACADGAQVILTQHQSFGVPVNEDKRLGKHPLVHYAEIGALGRNVTFSHMNVIRDDEVGPVRDSGMALAWAPANYMNWGVATEFRSRAPEMFLLGVPVNIGADVAKVWGFGDQGLIAYLLARDGGSYLSPENVLEMQTVCGARAVGLEQELGSLEVGKRADLVIRRDDLPEAWPPFDVVRNLALVSRHKSVRTVIVNGRVVLRDGRPTQVEDAEVYEIARKAGGRIIRRLGVHPGTSWPTVK